MKAVERELGNGVWVTVAFWNTFYVAEAYVYTWTHRDAQERHYRIRDTNTDTIEWTNDERQFQ